MLDLRGGVTRGYGLSFGHNERKTMAMGIVDRALRTREIADQQKEPAWHRRLRKLRSKSRIFLRKKRFQFIFMDSGTICVEGHI